MGQSRADRILARPVKANTLLACKKSSQAGEFLPGCIDYDEAVKTPSIHTYIHT
jgi:hypothetical protein